MLHIIFSLRTGGAETMLVDIVNHQCRNDHVTLLIINDEIDRWVRDGISRDVDVVEFRRKQGSSPLLLMWRLNRYIMRLKPDAIHIHNHKLAALVRVRRDRMILTVHDLRVPMKFTRGVKMCAISEAVKADILSRREEANVSVVSNGIHTERIVDRGGRAPADPFKIVEVARLDAAKKGQDILIGALYKLRQLGVSAELTLIGEGRDREMLEALVRKSGLEGYVHFAGKQTREEIYSQLCEYDAMCHPARYEGFGLTVAEGAAAGLPLIVPDEGGAYELTGNGRFAETFRNGDIESCSQAIFKVIENYPEALDKAREAKKHVESKFSVETMADSYLNIYTFIKVS